MTNQNNLPAGVSSHESLEPRFTGKQEGPAADLLQAEFCSELAMLPQVERAYFCKLEYPHGESGAAVCIASQVFGDMKVVEAIARVIRRYLDAKFHIDILFLTSTMEAGLRAVCDPFYVRAGN